MMYKRKVNNDNDLDLEQEIMTVARTQNATKGISQADSATLDSLLEELELGAAAEPELDDIIEEPAGDEIGELEVGAVSEDDIAALEAVIEKQEAYEEQDSTVTADPTAAAQAKADTKANKAAAKAAAKAAKNAAPATPKTPGAPRAARDLASTDAKFFVLEGDVPLDQATADLHKTATMALMPTQKKIAEKFENLFTALAAGKKPSTFITQAFELLDSKGSISSSDLVGAYKTVGAKDATTGYNEGTARSQAGQMMSLFDTVKIATRTKQDLVLNPASNIAALLRTVMATA